LERKSLTVSGVAGQQCPTQAVNMPNLPKCEHGIGARARVIFFDIDSRFDQPEKSI